MKTQRQIEKDRLTEGFMEWADGVSPANSSSNDVHMYIREFVAEGEWTNVREMFNEVIDDELQAKGMPRMFGTNRAY
jgi:hypothetical protein